MSESLPKPRRPRRRRRRPADAAATGNPEGATGKPEGTPSDAGKRRDSSRSGAARGPQERTEGGPRKRPRRRKAGPRSPAAAPTDAARNRPAAALPESRIDQAKPADVPLSPAEVAEMREHLQFMFQHRKLLRLKVNAAEDLLLNGVRPPTHRGVCMHLLAKVDRACVEGALERLGTDWEKSQLLAGAVRFSRDVGILLLYLESLTEARSRAAAAAVFSQAVAQIDFASLSAARMRRVLEIVSATFASHERVQVLFGLLHSDSFRATFDEATDLLPAELADLFIPLRAAFEVVIRGGRQRFDHGVVERGVAVLLSAPASALAAYPTAIRERLLDAALRPASPLAAQLPALNALLDSMPTTGRAFSRLGTRLAAVHLGRHDDDRAGKLLNRVQTAHPDDPVPGHWLRAIKAPRVGRLARLEAKQEGRRDSERESGRLWRGFWLDQQRDVLVRSVGADRRDSFAGEVTLQRRVSSPGVLPLVVSGVADNGTSFAAMPAVGVPLGRVLARPRPNRDQLLWVTLSGLLLLRGLALLGVVVPDCDPVRFRVEDTPLGSLALADFEGALDSDKAEAVAAHGTLAKRWCETTLRLLTGPDRSLGAAAREASIDEMIQRLAAAL